MIFLQAWQSAGPPEPVLDAYIAEIEPVVTALEQGVSGQVLASSALKALHARVEAADIDVDAWYRHHFYYINVEAIRRSGLNVSGAQALEAAAPACEIKIGHGTAADGPTDPTGGATGAGGAGGAAAAWTPTPEEQEAIDALQNVDLAVLQRIDAKNAYAAVVTSNLVAAQVPDPSTLDEATLSSLIDAAAPAAILEAEAWAQLADLVLFPPTAVYSKFECIEPPNNCPATTKCPGSPGAVCIVIDCARGKCPGYCPDFISNLASQGWCSYACRKGKEVVEGAFILQIAWGLRGPFCIGK